MLYSEAKKKLVNSTEGQKLKSDKLHSDALL